MYSTYDSAEEASRPPLSSSSRPAVTYSPYTEPPVSASASTVYTSYESPDTQIQTEAQEPIPTSYTSYEASSPTSSSIPSTSSLLAPASSYSSTISYTSLESFPDQDSPNISTTPALSNVVPDSADTVLSPRDLSETLQRVPSRKLLDLGKSDNVVLAKGPYTSYFCEISSL
jgi:hypothetical protein